MGGWGTIYNNTNSALRKNTELLARLQEQIVSGTRVIRPSDDPADAYRIQQLQGRIQSVGSYLKNLGDVSGQLEMGQGILQEISAGLTRLKELTTQAASGTCGQTGQRVIAAEVDSLLEQMVSLANTKSVGRYIFGGINTAATPYSIQRSQGQISGVSYQGSALELSVPVAAGINYSASLVGDRIFRADSRQSPLFSGATGAASGSGTSAVSGDHWLKVEHDATSFDGASAIAPGASSAAGDTILGSGHTVTIDVPKGTIRLDDGQEVALNGSSDLLLTNAAGDRLYVDVSNLQAGFAGTVGVSASGRMSLDGGAAVDLDFSANQAVTDPQSQRVLYVNSSDIARTGTVLVRVPGTHDLFGSLIHFRDLLLNTHELTSSELSDELGHVVGAIDEVADALTMQMTAAGGKLQALDSLQTSLEDIQATSQQQSAELANADLAELATQLARTQTLYEMTLQTAAKLLNMSLLDYL